MASIVIHLFWFFLGLLFVVIRSPDCRKDGAGVLSFPRVVAVGDFGASKPVEPGGLFIDLARVVEKRL